MFRTLIYPSSGACNYSVELPNWSYCSWFDVCWSFGVAGLEWYPCCRPHPYAPHAQPVSFFSILSPAQYWVRSTNHLGPHYAISSIPPSTWIVCCAMFPQETLPPGDPSGGVVYLRIVLSPEQASRMCVFLNKDFYREGLLAPRPTPKLEDHPSSAVRDCLLNLFAATLLIECRSSIRNLRTHHAFVTGTHYAYIFYYYVRCCILSN